MLLVVDDFENDFDNDVCNDEEGNDSDHLSTSRIIDSRNLCYGQAFVVLAGASAMILGRL